MIQAFIQSALTLLSANLPDAHVLAEPVIPAAADLPTIILYPGKYVPGQIFRDTLTGNPVVQAAQQVIQVASGASRAGPYPLAHFPTSGSMLAKLVNADGSTTLLAEGQDFTLDITKPAISFPASRIKAGSQVQLNYAFAWSSMVCEFQQELLVDVFAADLLGAEKWGSLVIGILLSNMTDLLLASRTAPQAEYRAGLYSTVHSIDQVLQSHGEFTPFAIGYKFQLVFNTAGKVNLGRELKEGFDVIKQVDVIASTG